MIDLMSYQRLKMDSATDESMVFSFVLALLYSR